MFSRARAASGWLSFLVFAFMVSSPAIQPMASAQSTPGTGDRPKIGLALSGGGARGAAHVGVLRVLEAHRVPVDYIAGTSMGAIVGGLYAAGYSPDELEALMVEVDWVDAFDDRVQRRKRSFRRKRDDDLYLVKQRPGFSSGSLKFPPGILDGQRIALLLKRFTLPVATTRDFDDLGIPYRAVATDLVTGKPVVMDHGDLALAIRASMSLPVVFVPREIDGRLLIDGGVSVNLPIDVVRGMGADIVIAVDISSPLQERRALESVLGVTDQLITMLTRRDTDRQIATLTDRDIFIVPQLGDIKTGSFDRAAEAIPLGETAALAVLDELAALSIPEPDYQAHVSARRRPRPQATINEVKIVNHSRLADRVIANRLNIETGAPPDVERIEAQLGQIYGLELFESAYYDITGDPTNATLTATIQESSWGPNYLQFGVAVFEDYEGPNFNISAAYTRTAINRLNGEWRTGIQFGQEPGAFTELFQPIDSRLRKFVHLRAHAYENAVSSFDAMGQKLLELGVRRYGVQAALGRELGTWGECRVGLAREAGKTRIQVGDPAIPRESFDTGEAFAQFFVDELDNIRFPRSGGALRVRAIAGRKGLGSDTDYEQGLATGSWAYTAGRYTSFLGALLGTTRDGDAPIQNRFRLGGFARLSGLEQDELYGQNAALLFAALYRQWGNFGAVSLYNGLTAEYGNVYQNRNDIRLGNGVAAGSVFLGIDTLIGPIHIAYGIAEGGRDNFYLMLGQSFASPFGVRGW